MRIVRFPRFRPGLAVGVAVLATLFAILPSRAAVPVESLQQSGCRFSSVLSLLSPQPLPQVTEIRVGRSAQDYFGHPLTVAPRKGLAALRPNNFKPLIRGLQWVTGKKLLTELGTQVELLQLLKPGQRYTFVIQGERLAFSDTGTHWLNDLLSKHRTMAGKADEVHFAGEMWLDDQGRLVIINSSGTYRTPPHRVEAARRYFEEVFEAKDVQVAYDGKSIPLEKPAVSKIVPEKGFEPASRIPEVFASLSGRKDLPVMVRSAVTGDLEALRAEIDAMKTADFVSEESFKLAKNKRIEQLREIFKNRLRAVSAALDESPLTAAEKAQIWEAYAAKFSEVNPPWRMDSYRTRDGGYLYTGYTGYYIWIQPDGKIVRANVEPASRLSDLLPKDHAPVDEEQLKALGKKPAPAKLPEPPPSAPPLSRKIDPAVPEVGDLNELKEQAQKIAAGPERIAAFKAFGDAFDQCVRDVLLALQEQKLPASEKAFQWNRWARKFMNINPNWGQITFKTSDGKFLFVGSGNYTLLIDERGVLHKAMLPKETVDRWITQSRGDHPLPDTAVDGIGFKRIGQPAAKETAPVAAPTLQTVDATIDELARKLDALKTMKTGDFESSKAFADALDARMKEFDGIFHATVSRTLDRLQEMRLPADEKARIFRGYAEHFTRLKRTWNQHYARTAGGRHVFVGTKDYLLIIDTDGTLYKAKADKTLKERIQRGLVTDEDLQSVDKTRREAGK